MYINMTKFSPENAERVVDNLKEMADQLKKDGIRLIYMPIINDLNFINRVECLYPHFVVMDKEEIEKIENLNKEIKDSLNIDAIIETLMKRIYQPEKQIG